MYSVGMKLWLQLIFRLQIDTILSYSVKKWGQNLSLIVALELTTAFSEVRIGPSFGVGTCQEGLLEFGLG